jgi:hypothetical protein
MSDVVEDVRTVFENKNDTTIFIPDLLARPPELVGSTSSYY